MPSVSISTKIECLNGAFKLVKKQYDKNMEACYPYESLVSKPLWAISDYLNKLKEDNNKNNQQLRMADELLPTANAWLENCDLPPLSKNKFASQIELQSIHIKTQKEEGSIHYESELFFQDTEDTFAGYFLYATIENDKVKEITLMG